MARLLYVHPRNASFIAVDRELLARRHEIEDFYQPGRWTNLLRLLPALRRCDAVVAWWVSWHSFFPITLAPALRKPTLLIIGGFDTAAMPEIGYGFQVGGARRALSRFVMRRATRLMTNSAYSREEIARNIGLDVPFVHHGVPDPFGELPEPAGEPVALSVGLVTSDNLDIKGQRAFVAAAAHLPDVRFVLAGPLIDADAERELRALATPNVELTGWLEQDDLHARFAAASVYVQPSHHEGFGIAVAEAMLGGCVPVGTRSGALPEVIGDAGVLLDSRDPEAIAAGVRGVLDAGPDARAAARARVLERFSLDMRARGLEEQLTAAMGHA